MFIIDLCPKTFIFFGIKFEKLSIEFNIILLLFENDKREGINHLFEVL